MVRCANRPNLQFRYEAIWTPCVTHHFRGGTLHAPYNYWFSVVLRSFSSA